MRKLCVLTDKLFKQLKLALADVVEATCVCLLAIFCAGTAKSSKNMLSAVWYCQLAVSRKWSDCSWEHPVMATNWLSITCCLSDISPWMLAAGAMSSPRHIVVSSIANREGPPESPPHGVWFWKSMWFKFGLLSVKWFDWKNLLLLLIWLWLEILTYFVCAYVFCHYQTFFWI